MEEPSVLDYLKSKLNPWSREKIEIQESADEEPESDSIPQPAAVEGNAARPLPWRSLSALAIALFAQSRLEPPADLILAAILYLLALSLLAWALWVGEWIFPALPEEPEERIDPGFFRPVSLGISLVLTVLAFVFFVFSDNRFNLFNTGLWLAAIAFFIHAFWLGLEETFARAWQALRRFFARPNWQISVTRWGLLLLLVWGVALFFRFSSIDSLPAEPFSDHAEKLMDVYDLTTGQTKIFFERNTGREFIQFYLTAFVAWFFNTGLSFLSLKLGTALLGFFTLPYIYLLGKEIGGKRVALFALAFAAIAYWPNVISRVGLRFPLYPFFVAPVLFYLLRGLRTQNRNDFILSGLFLGLGLHGYSSFRFVPIVVLAIVGIYLLHKLTPGLRQQTLTLFSILVFSASLTFLPLLAYAILHPGQVVYRAMTRIAETERAFPAPPLEVFFDNLKNALLMLNVDNGDIWVNSVTGRPALDIVAGALFILGIFMLLVRYLRSRDWRDLTLMLSVPLLLMPSILSLAFPGENPSLNRAGGAYVVVFVILAIGLDGLFDGLRRQGWRVISASLVAGLFVFSAALNYNLVFDRYASQYRAAVWNTSEIAAVVDSFETAGNTRYNAWVLPYPHWIDTRLVGVWLGDPTYDPVLWPDQVGETRYQAGNKLFFVKQDDFDSLTLLREIYPQGALSYHRAAPGLIGRDFWVFSVPELNNIFDANAPQP